MNDKITEYEFHEAAGLFPLMKGHEFTALVEDIRQNGLKEPIWLFEGKILDGRNRYKACQELGIEPETRDWLGDLDRLLSHVVSLNLHRRHLNESQKAMVAARLANISHGGDRRSDQAANLQFGPKTNSLTVCDVADQLAVSPRTVETARKVLKHGAPEVIDAVERGVVSVSDAAAVVERPTQAQTALLSEVMGGSTKKLRSAARQHDVAQQRRDIAEGNIILPEGKFEIISIDPLSTPE